MTSKTIVVDWDSLPEITALFNKVKSRYFELKRMSDGSPSRKDRSKLVFDSCQSIFNTDISSVYAAMNLDTARKYYVYAHLDTSHKIALGFNGVTTFAATLGIEYFPFYIGKGTAGRCDDTNRNGVHRKIIQKLRLLGKEPLVVKLRDNLTESESLQLEAKLIDVFGLISMGGYLDEGANALNRRGLYKDAFRRVRLSNSLIVGT